MKQVTKKLANTIGLDLGDRVSRYCRLNRAGQSVEGSVATTKAALRKHFAELKPSHIAIEIGTHACWVADLLRELGHTVVVANAREVKAVSQSLRKNDRNDARLLADLLLSNARLLRPVSLRSPQSRNDLAQINARAVLVEARTKLINSVRGMVKARGDRIAKKASSGFHKLELPAALQPALKPVMKAVEHINAQIKVLDDQIAELCERYPVTNVLRQVAGVGQLTAAAFVLKVENPARFLRGEQIGSYFGLCPGQRQSGNSDPQQRTTKAGDRMMRTLLVQAAHYILGRFGPDCDLRRSGLRIAESGGRYSKRRAVVATARKLAVLLHALWRSGEVYEPLRNTLKAQSPALQSA